MYGFRTLQQQTFLTLTITNHLFVGSEQGSEWNSVNISIQRQDLAAIRIHAQTHVSARSDGDIAIDDVMV